MRDRRLGGGGVVLSGWYPRPLGQVMLTYVAGDAPPPPGRCSHVLLPKCPSGLREGRFHLLHSIPALFCWMVVRVASREDFFCASPLFPTPLRVEPKRIVGLTEAGGFWDSPNCDGLVLQWPEAQDLTPLGSAN